LVEQDGIDILTGIAADYYSYREWIREYIAENGRPLMPSIHAGSITADIGGTAEEPLFRGQPMDDNLALIASLHMLDEGAESVVVFGVDREEMTMQKETAAKACAELGIEVLDEVTIQHSMTYTAEAAAAVALNPDAIILFAQGETSGTLVKNLYEAGFTGKIIGETNSTNEEFFNTATQEAISSMEFVRAATYAPAGEEATGFYYDAWDDPANSDVLDGVDNDINSTYVLSTYDILNATCLAIEAAGSTDPGPWVDAMRQVTNPPGKKVYTYLQGMEALEAGEEIDYDGVTGTFEYTETGVVNGIYAIANWEDNGTLRQETIIDADRVSLLGLELVE
jgi:ABC-type branched-subunit amino acid transport system substrate-binding protein